MSLIDPTSPYRQDPVSMSARIETLERRLEALEHSQVSQERQTVASFRVRDLREDRATTVARFRTVRRRIIALTLTMMTSGFAAVLLLRDLHERNSSQILSAGGAATTLVALMGLALHVAGRNRHRERCRQFDRSIRDELAVARPKEAPNTDNPNPNNDQGGSSTGDTTAGATP
jgi:hypothetical protein